MARWRGEWLLVLFAAVGCREAHHSDPGCPAAGRELEVRYGGAASGTGRLALAPIGNEYKVDMTLYDEQDRTKKVLTLSGPGVCEHGILRVRFGGGDSEASTARVLGGKLEGMLQPQLLDTEFWGAWSADIVSKQDGARLTMTGFLEEDPHAADAPVVTVSKAPSDPTSQRSDHIAGGP